MRHAHDEDPRERVRQLQRFSERWLCWYGNTTGHYWAVTRYGEAILVEARTAKELLDEMTRIEISRGSGMPNGGAW